MSVLFPFKLAAKLLAFHGESESGSNSSSTPGSHPLPEPAASPSQQQQSSNRGNHNHNHNQQPPAPLADGPQHRFSTKEATDHLHAPACRLQHEMGADGRRCDTQTGWGVNGVDNVSPKHHAYMITSSTLSPSPSTNTMPNETTGNSTKDDAAGSVNPWVQYYLDSTAAALGTHPPAGDHLASDTHASLVLTPSPGGKCSFSSEQLRAATSAAAAEAMPAQAPSAACLGFAPTAPRPVPVPLGSALATFQGQGQGVISSTTFSATAGATAGEVQSRSAFLSNPNLNLNNTRALALSATAQALLARSGSTSAPTSASTPTHQQSAQLQHYHHYYRPMYHPQAMYHPQFHHQQQQHSTAHQPGYYPLHPPAPLPHPHPQPHPHYQPAYPSLHPPPAMYFSTTPSPPLAPSPVAPPHTPPPPPSASPTHHFAPYHHHQHSPTWPPPPSPTDPPPTSAPPAQLNPTNYLLSLASISLAVLQPFLFYQATGSPTASAALRRSTPAALVPKAITSVLITLFISCVMIPAFLTATAVAWARSGKQQALRDMREVVLVVHSRWMGDDLKHITRPLAQGLTVLGNVIEHAPSVKLTPGLVRGALSGVGPAGGAWRDLVVDRVVRAAATTTTGLPGVAVLVQYLRPLVPRQVLASVVAAVLGAAGGGTPVPVPVPVVGGEGSAIQEVRVKERSPRTHRKSKTSAGEGAAKSPKKRKSAGVGSSKASPGSSRASDSGRS